MPIREGALAEGANSSGSCSGDPKRWEAVGHLDTDGEDYYGTHGNSVCARVSGGGGGRAANGAAAVAGLRRHERGAGSAHCIEQGRLLGSY